MNIPKGFFRLTLVLSILIGIITPFAHEWILGEIVIRIKFPDGWADMSSQQKQSHIDSLLSNNIRFSLLPETSQLKIRKDLSLLSYRANVIIQPGWRELSLLAFIGFAFPWLIYLFIRWVIVAFIIGGFRHKANS